MHWSQSIKAPIATILPLFFLFFFVTLNDPSSSTLQREKSLTSTTSVFKFTIEDESQAGLTLLQRAIASPISSKYLASTRIKHITFINKRGYQAIRYIGLLPEVAANEH